MEAVGVGVAHDVEPVAREVFAVARRGEQTRDDAVVGIGRAVGEKRIHFLRRRRQAREIECETAQQHLARSLGRELEFFIGELGADEAINRAVFGFRAAGGLGQFGTRDGFVSPVVLIDGALLDPALDQGALLGLERELVRVGRRHDFFRVVAQDTLPGF